MLLAAQLHLRRSPAQQGFNLFLVGQEAACAHMRYSRGPDCVSKNACVIKGFALVQGGNEAGRKRISGTNRIQNLNLKTRAHQMFLAGQNLATTRSGLDNNQRETASRQELVAGSNGIVLLSPVTYLPFRGQQNICIVQGRLN